MLLYSSSGTEILGYEGYGATGYILDWEWMKEGHIKASST